MAFFMKDLYTGHVAEGPASRALPNRTPCIAKVQLRLGTARRRIAARSLLAISSKHLLPGTLQ